MPKPSKSKSKSKSKIKSNKKNTTVSNLSGVPSSALAISITSPIIVAEPTAFEQLNSEIEGVYQRLINKTVKPYYYYEPDIDVSDVHTFTILQMLSRTLEFKKNNDEYLLTFLQEKNYNRVCLTINADTIEEFSTILIEKTKFLTVEEIFVFLFEHIDFFNSKNKQLALYIACLANRFLDDYTFSDLSYIKIYLGLYLLDNFKTDTVFCIDVLDKLIELLEKYTSSNETLNKRIIKTIHFNLIKAITLINSSTPNEETVSRITNRLIKNLQNFTSSEAQKKYDVYPFIIMALDALIRNKNKEDIYNFILACCKNDNNKWRLQDAGKLFESCKSWLLHENQESFIKLKASIIRYGVGLPVGKRRGADIKPNFKGAGPEQIKACKENISYFKKINTLLNFLLKLLNNYLQEMEGNLYSNTSVFKKEDLVLFKKLIQDTGESIDGETLKIFEDALHALPLPALTPLAVSIVQPDPIQYECISKQSTQKAKESTSQPVKQPKKNLPKPVNGAEKTPSVENKLIKKISKKPVNPYEKETWEKAFKNADLIKLYKTTLQDIRAAFSYFHLNKDYSLCLNNASASLTALLNHAEKNKLPFITAYAYLSKIETLLIRFLGAIPPKITSHETVLKSVQLEKAKERYAKQIVELFIEIKIIFDTFEPNVEKAIQSDLKCHWEMLHNNCQKNILYKDNSFENESSSFLEETAQYMQKINELSRELTSLDYGKYKANLQGRYQDNSNPTFKCANKRVKLQFELIHLKTKYCLKHLPSTEMLTEIFSKILPKKVLLPPFIQESFKYLGDLTGKLYLVGGRLLALLEGKEPHSNQDLDFELKSNFNNPLLVQLTDKRFVRSPHVQNLFTGNFNRIPVDIMLSDKELKRDFTISAMACDAEGNIFGDGLEDIIARRLRTLGDPGSCFEEDPVRLLRAIKYIVMGYKPTADVDKAIFMYQTNQEQGINRGHLNAVARKHWGSLNFKDKTHYFNMLISYGLLEKLFDITSDLQNRELFERKIGYTLMTVWFIDNSKTQNDVLTPAYTFRH